MRFCAIAFRTALDNQKVEVSRKVWGILTILERVWSKVKKFKAADFILCVQDMCRCGGKIYLLDNKDGLFVYDRLKGDTAFLGQIEGNNDARYMKIHALDHSALLFVPYGLGDIVGYNIEEEKFYIFSQIVRNKDINYMPWKDMFRYKDRAYFLGLDSIAGILRVDIPTGKSEIKTEWKRNFHNKFGCEASLYFNINACQVGHFFWVPLNIKNMIMKYDMETDRSFFYRVGEEEIHYATICYDGRFFWLSGDAPAIVRWNAVTNETILYRSLPEGLKKRTFTDAEKNKWDSFFLNSLIWHGRIYFSPLCANMIIALDLEKEEFIEIKKVANDVSWFPLYILDENYLYFQEQRADSQCQCVREYCISYEGETEDGILGGRKIYGKKNAFLSGRKLAESYPSMLEDYIESFSKQENESRVQKDDNYLRKWKVLFKDV